jgi:threonine dehydratase
LITRDDIRAAHKRIAPYVRRTPTLSLEQGALGLGYRVSLKLEHTQATGSFKLRGAFNNLLSNPLPKAGVVAISGGNHGAAVAHAATTLGVPSTVYVPGAIAVEVKMQRMRDFGAEVVAVPGHVEDAFEAYTAHAKKTGALEVHPYDSDLTLTGQGTVAAEIQDQMEIDTLLVSVGGGGLIGGVLSWMRDDVRVVSVETTQTDCLAKSRAAGKLVSIVPGGISASGLGANQIGTLGWEAAQRWLADSIVVTDEDTIEAQRRLWAAARLVVEPGAATALAALTSGAYAPEKDERVGVLLCGGNAAPDWFVG